LLFAREGWSPQDDRSIVSLYFDAGVVFNGLITARPDDSFGVAVSHTRFARPFRRATSGLAPSETTLEFCYSAKLAEHWTLIFDLQVLLSGARRTGADDATYGSRRPAVVPGLRTVFSF
jgi:carbohydrate-selective porin OprB